MSDQSPRLPTGNDPSGRTTFRILRAISVSHFLNDTLQSLMIAIYPLFNANFQLSFAQIGLITFAFRFTASLLQPAVCYYTDRHPQPFSLAVGMSCTFAGLLTLSLASSYPMLLLAAALVGSGSAVLGQLADLWGIDAVYRLCSFLPLLGLLAVFLPNLRTVPAPRLSAEEAG